ncbi:hypothetical protein L596_012517 [Steinernema carpocapsae]|uniref:G-protein coupled receptors family 1 profile domain-containing protein n=1 Tax=Steinernema carpocapsae TaxID=34508 RepID=A0A4U5NXM9_STECR|nr:hypothetical protein L596_012517 [Steinernema carpocapsae]
MSSERDDMRASFVIMVIGLIGVIINLYVLNAVPNLKSFGYAFGSIVMSHTVANLGITGVFSLLVAPITIINPSFHDTYWGKRCGQVLIMFWNAAVFSHLLIAFNRFVSVYWPIKYIRIFDKTVTNITISLAWTLAFAQVFSYFWIECTFGFSTETYTFTFVTTTCGYYIGFIFDYYMSIIMISIIATMDFCTFIKIRILKRQMSSTVQSNQDMSQRVKDIRFFFQAVAQGLVFIGELVSFFSISTMFDDKWPRFGFTTVAWISVHTIDGLIVILFNKDVRHYWRTAVYSYYSNQTAPSTAQIYHSHRAMNAPQISLSQEASGNQSKI